MPPKASAFDWTFGIGSGVVCRVLRPATCCQFLGACLATHTLRPRLSSGRVARIGVRGRDPHRHAFSAGPLPGWIERDEPAQTLRSLIDPRGLASLRRFDRPRKLQPGTASASAGDSACGPSGFLRGQSHVLLSLSAFPTSSSDLARPRARACISDRWECRRKERASPD